MISLLAATGIAHLGQSGHIKHLDRVSFHLLLRQVDFGWSEKQVRELLGPPDDIVTVQTAGTAPPPIIWQYGTTGHLTAPLLGSIDFDDGKAWPGPNTHIVPTPLSVISDRELSRHLLFIESLTRPPREPIRADPLFFIAVTNRLMHLGKPKALAVLYEWARDTDQLDELFWIVRVLFLSADSGEPFELPKIGLIMPPPPTDLHLWPDFPMITEGDVPFMAPIGVGLVGGFPEQFSDYIKRCSNDWRFRVKPLRPPDDPFSLCATVLASPRWNQFPMQSDPEWVEHERSEIIWQILRLVRTAYHPSGIGIEGDGTTKPADLAQNFDRYHAEYLAVGGHWDNRKQRYVRRDGSTIKDPDDGRLFDTWWGVGKP